MKTLRTALLVLLLVVVMSAMHSAQAGPPRNINSQDLAKLKVLLLKGDHFKVRVQAAKALGLMKVHAAVPDLLRALRTDNDHLVRGTAAWALGNIGHPGAIEALILAEKKDVDFVIKQATRARQMIVARFPSNLPAFAKTLFHLDVDGLTDPVTKGRQLQRYFQSDLAEIFAVYENFDFGEVMEIEEKGARPDQVTSFKPLVRLKADGAVEDILEPRDRAPGEVEVKISFKVLWVPPKKALLQKKTYRGTARFEGGPKPASELDPDPLLEARKQALQGAVKAAARDLTQSLKAPR